MKTLFDKSKIGNLKVKNRLFRSATWEKLASEDGRLNTEIYAIYEELAKGGVGTIVTGLTDVSKNNIALAGNMRLYEDFLIEDYKRLTDIVHRYDCNILTEINMDKYVAENDSEVLQIKDINDLTKRDIENIIDLFAQSSLRAMKAGFDGVQIHLAYGWLLNRFVNPLLNQRKDEYGGSCKNRLRIITEMITAIRSIKKDFHISVKFSFFDNDKGEFAITECVNICKLLSLSKIDSLEILGGHSPKEKGTQYEACYLELALAVKSVIDTPIILTGNNHDIDNMKNLLNNDGIEYFGMSRPLIREPDLPNRWLEGCRKKSICISCNGCYTTYGNRCVFS